ncbi:alpha/beta-hydrolase [Xylariaceae sp. FL0255]|nr:alpha/beta-hydrolase [Xylariaceae sp. FL0255]
MSTVEEVEFKAVDGGTLRGRMFPAASRGPGVVMVPGSNTTKDMSGLPETSRSFQAAGITALIYDHRGIGASDGSPRNDINPFLQVDDLSDALSFLSSCATVDPRQGVGLWGYSLGGSVAMVTAALDPRAHFLIAVCPITEITLRPVLAKTAKGRESQVKGNESFYVPMLNKHGENPAGFNPGFDEITIRRLLESYNELDPLRVSLAENHVNRTTVGTYRHMLLWDMQHMWKYITQPTLFTLARNDSLLSVDTQMVHFNKTVVPKKLHVQEEAGHMDILEGESHKSLSSLQIEFIRDALVVVNSTALTLGLEKC